MKSTYIEYGDAKMEIEVSDSAMVLTPEDLRQDPPQVDPYEATGKALENPLGMPALKDLAKPGMKVVICCPDRVKEGFTLKDTEGWFAESLFECEKVAKEFGVTLALEPLNRYETNFINTLDEGIEFIKKIGFQNVKILADTFHMNIEEVSVPGAIIAARDYLSHIHFADSNRYAPGDGHLNFRGIVDALVKIKYKGFITMEMLPKPDPVTAAKRAVNYLKGLRI